MCNEFMFVLDDDMTAIEPYATIVCQTEEDYNDIIEALEKQKAKRPLDADITNEHGYGYCPLCGMHVDVFEHNPYCDCGQKIDWSDNGHTIHE